MDPFNQPEQQASTVPSPTPSIDYLNQIAPQTPKRFRLTHMQLIIVVALAIVTIIVLAVVIGAFNNKDPLEHLSAKLQSTEIVVGDAQSKIKSTQLRALNSNLKIYLTNTNRDIAPLLLQDSVNVAKLDKNIVASEATNDITDRLEDARLNAIYDRTYAREIAYRLETTLALMHQINDSSASKDLKTFLIAAIANLEPTQQSFADFNATNG
jgi:hypothetical protein